MSCSSRCARSSIWWPARNTALRTLFDELTDRLEKAFGHRLSANASPGATAAASPASQRQAWEQLLALRARLRVMLGRSTSPPKHIRLRAQPSTPVVALSCRVAHCNVAVRTLLTVGRDRTKLPTQHLRLVSGKRTVVRVPLSRSRLWAVRHHRGGKLTLTLVSRGHARTLHARLTV
jgi:hypothetical protein